MKETLKRQKKYTERTELKLTADLNNKIKAASDDFNITKASFLRLAITTFLRDSGYIKEVK